MGVTRVKITKDGMDAEVMPTAVPAWERNGWTVADDGSSEEAVEETAAPAKKKTTRKAE
jgi:hypothetical protein